MIVSTKKKFVFIHLYKTAGTSVTNIFLPYGRASERLLYGGSVFSRFLGKVVNRLGLNDSFSRTFTGYHKHERACVVSEKMGEEKYQSYFSFGFVRNPYDFLVSLYLYIRQDKYHFAHDEVSSMTFAEFVNWEISNKPVTQFEFMADQDGENLIVDFIGKFESLQEDLAQIQERLGLTVQQASHLNPSKKRKLGSYRDYYDDESRARVAEYFKRDLEVFDYTF